MKRLILLLHMLIIVSSLFQVEAKSTMELLINKDWHEFDFGSMTARDDYYVRYTGTQRIIVGSDSVGNQNARVQKYYLSYRYEEKFDSTKVGKIRDGKYLIIQGSRDSLNNKNVICLEINELGEGQLQVKNLNHPRLLQTYFISDDALKQEKQGKFQSTIDLLADKIWYMLDENGERTGMEWTFGYSAYFRCTMPENRRKEFPKWERREFYLSDNIETEFKRSKVCEKMNGIYLVVNDLDEDGTWQTRTYDIKTLSANRLILECVYPKGYGTFIFENSYTKKEKSISKIKPQQKDLLGKEWFRVDTATWKRSKYIEKFTETHVTRIFPKIKNNKVVSDTVNFEYYMSNQPVTEFDWSQKGKNPEGDYIIVNEMDPKGEFMPVSYQIITLEGCNLFTVNVSHPDSIMHIYERDKTYEEVVKMNSLGVNMIDRPKSMKEKLIGKQWYYRFDTGLKSLVAPNYFTESHVAQPYWRKTNKGYKGKMMIGDWWLSDNTGSSFSTQDNGLYLHKYYKDMYIGNRRANRYEVHKIYYISDELLVLGLAYNSRHKHIIVFVSN